MMKYSPNPPIISPAPLRNQRLARLKEELASSRFTVAVELPATAMGRQWPAAKSRISNTPVNICP